jgi:hypothetical protein
LQLYNFARQVIVLLAKLRGRGDLRLEVRLNILNLRKPARRL